MFKRLWSSLILAFIASIYCMTAYAATIVEADGTVNIASGANTVYLDVNQTNLVTAGSARYSHIIVWTSSGASTIYVEFNEGQTATTSNAQIPGGASVSVGLAGFSRAVNAINYYSNGSTGTLSWMAW